MNPVVPHVGAFGESLGHQRFKIGSMLQMQKRTCLCIHACVNIDR